MANLVFINENELINSPSINLLPVFAMFNDVFTWNIVSGTATATNLNQNQLEGDRCLRVVPNYGTGAVVNSGGTQMQTTVSEDGNYVFSIKHKCEIPSLTSMQVKVKIYINDVLTDYQFTASATYNNDYRTYYQVITDLIAGDVLDFAFEFGTSDGAGTYKHYFDAPKLEFDNFGLGLPTVFSFPQEAKLTQFSFDYNNDGSPQAYTTGELLLENDGVGAFTNTDLIPTIHSGIYNTSTDTFDFSSLNIGDAVLIRLDITVTTTSANQIINSYLELGQGVAPYQIMFHSHAGYKTINTYENLTIESRVTILNNTTKDNPAQFKFNSDDDATVLVNGYNITVLTTT